MKKLILVLIILASFLTAGYEKYTYEQNYFEEAAYSREAPQRYETDIMYTPLRANGELCGYNKQCISGVCGYYQPVLNGVLNGGGAPLCVAPYSKANGETCFQNNECMSNQCGPDEAKGLIRLCTWSTGCGNIIPVTSQELAQYEESWLYYGGPRVEIISWPIPACTAVSMPSNPSALA